MATKPESEENAPKMKTTEDVLKVLNDHIQ